MFVLLGAALWGSNGVAGAVVAVNSEMSWAAIVAVRLIIGGLAMMAATVFSGGFKRLKHNRITWQVILLTAACSAVFAASYFQSLEYIGVAVSTVASLGASTALLTAASILRDKKWPRTGTTIALVASLVGLVLVCMPDSTGWTSGGADYATGIGLSALSGVAFGASTLLNSRPVEGLGPQALVGVSFTIAGVMCLPWAAVTGFAFGTMTSTAWLALALLIFVSTLLGFLAYYTGLHRGVQPTTVAISTAVEPVFAGLLAVLILQEKLTALMVVGVVFILLSILLVRPKPEPASVSVPSAP
jgi:DME family drug/metabolite transporter